MSTHPRHIMAISSTQPQRGPSSAIGGSDVIGEPRITQCRATGFQHLKIAQWNADGIRNKKTDLQNFLRQHSIDICCVQETHLPGNLRFSIRGYECYHQDRETRSKGGVLTLVKNNIPSVEIKRSGTENTEFVAIKAIINNMTTLTIYNLYSPPDKQIDFQGIESQNHSWMILGDFNSHSPSWGYDDINNKGEEVENWIINNHLSLINKPDDPPTFYSKPWRTTSTPDLAIATDDLQSISNREVCTQLGGSDHRPVIIYINQVIEQHSSMQPSWNYKKSNWDLFRILVDDGCNKLSFSEYSLHQNVLMFNETVLNAAKISIPRGRRRNYKPFWSQHLQELEKQVNRARDIMESTPTDDNVLIYNKKKAEFTRAKIHEVRCSWYDKTKYLNFEQDSQRLWRLTKCLNEEQTVRPKTVLDIDGQLLHGKQAANCFAKTYEKRSSLIMPRERITDVHNETQRKLETNVAENYMMDRITMPEFVDAIRRLRLKKAPGPDGISNEMLKNLGPTAQSTLLDIFNQSWEKGIVPTIWKEAYIVPVLKKDKSKSHPDSYRPISLLSCVGKLLERIINRRLMWHIESNNIISPTQSGYRQYRSTEDQLAFLAQEVENAFQQKKKMLAVFFDLTQAFDKVWRKGLMLKLLETGVSGRMYWWTKNFLHNRTAKVKVDNILSHRVKIREGVPQGGVISPTLFVIYINEITNCVARYVSNTLHADDFAVWSASENTSETVMRLQETVNNVSIWSKRWGLTISTTKTCAILFSLSTKKETVKLKIGDSTIPQVNFTTFLGAKLDARLTWNPHIDTARAKAFKRLALMKKLAGTKWGACSRVLKQVYTAYVRPVMEYASTSWSSSAMTKKAKLDRVQNWGLRLILGALKSTPIADMQKTADIVPLENRRHTKILIQSEKMRRLPSHPLSSKLGENTINRLKRKCLNHLVKDLRESVEDILPNYNEPCDQLTPERWLNSYTDPEIRQFIPGIAEKDKQSPTAQRALAMDYLEQTYPTNSWVCIYTDGSSMDAMRNGGSGVFIQCPGQQEVSFSMPVGQICTNFRAEVHAMTEAVNHVLTMDLAPNNIVILTDSLSALQTLFSRKADAILQNLQDSLRLLCVQHRVVLQWIPAHCGIYGNEQADKLAKEGSHQLQPYSEFSFQEVKSLLKHQEQADWRRTNGGYNPLADSIRLLDREKATIIYRLRTGHCCLRAHLGRMNLVESPLCVCSLSDETPIHVLQDCPTYAVQRNMFWPQDTNFHTKLWGSVSDLELTTNFILSTGLKI